MRNKIVPVPTTEYDLPAVRTGTQGVDKAFRLLVRVGFTYQNTSGGPAAPTTWTSNPVTLPYDNMLLRSVLSRFMAQTPDSSGPGAGPRPHRVSLNHPSLMMPIDTFVSTGINPPANETTTTLYGTFPFQMDFGGIITNIEPFGGSEIVVGLSGPMNFQQVGQQLRFGRAGFVWSIEMLKQTTYPINGTADYALILEFEVQP